jgi:hypothetical protein
MSKASSAVSRADTCSICGRDVRDDDEAIFNPAALLEDGLTLCGSAVAQKTSTRCIKRLVAYA